MHDKRFGKKGLGGSRAAARTRANERNKSFLRPIVETRGIVKGEVYNRTGRF